MQTKCLFARNACAWSVYEHCLHLVSLCILAKTLFPKGVRYKVVCVLSSARLVLYTNGSFGTWLLFVVVVAFLQGSSTVHVVNQNLIVFTPLYIIMYTS